MSDRTKARAAKKIPKLKPRVFVLYHEGEPWLTIDVNLVRKMNSEIYFQNFLKNPDGPVNNQLTVAIQDDPLLVMDLDILEEYYREIELDNKTVLEWSIQKALTRLKKLKPGPAAGPE